VVFAGSIAGGRKGCASAAAAGRCAAEEEEEEEEEEERRCRLRSGCSNSPPLRISQHTSAYVGIRQHTSAYVSIRQHMSKTTAPSLRQYVYFCTSKASKSSIMHAHLRGRAPNLASVCAAPAPPAVPAAAAAAAGGGGRRASEVEGGSGGGGGAFLGGISGSFFCGGVFVCACGDTEVSASETGVLTGLGGEAFAGG
jgi:hypothetical protein